MGSRYYRAFKRLYASPQNCRYFIARLMLVRCYSFSEYILSAIRWKSATICLSISPPLQTDVSVSGPNVTISATYVFLPGMAAELHTESRDAQLDAAFLPGRS